MVQIDYEITIFYKVFLKKNPFGDAASEPMPRGSLTPNSIPPPPWTPPTTIMGGKYHPTAPHWGLGSKPSRNKTSEIKKIIRLHTQQSPTWRLITVTPPQLHLLDYPLNLDVENFSCSLSCLKDN